MFGNFFGLFILKNINLQILFFFLFSTNSLFAIPSNQEFVFFKPKQQDRFTFLLDLLNDTFEIGNSENSNDFREFLNQHIVLAQTEGQKNIYFLRIGIFINYLYFKIQVFLITWEDTLGQVFLWY
jgi:hypothetical protein